MKKIILIIIVVLVLAGAGVALYAWFTQGGSAGTGGIGGTGGTLPTPVPSATPGGPLVPPTGNYASSTAFPTSTTIVIGTPQGSVTVKNFYKNASLITPDAQSILIVASPSYNIAYSVPDSSFSIALLSEPLAAARTAAEAAFLNVLGIDQTNACRLTVYEEVPSALSATYAGENLGLSFCPGAIGF